MSWKSKQLTPGAKQYGITTAGAACHIEAMLESGSDWDTLTGFDRACIAEMQTFADQCARLVDANPSIPLPPAKT
jgi:hypothetical protein